MHTIDFIEVLGWFPYYLLPRYGNGINKNVLQKHFQILTPLCMVLKEATLCRDCDIIDDRCIR